MTLYYIGPCLRITHEAVEVHWPSHRSFPIRELAGVHAVRERRPAAVGSHQLRVGSTWLAGAAAVVLVTGWPVFHSGAASVLALAILAMSAGVSAACWRARVHPYALRAFYRGDLVTLFRTPDARTFGQVKRALMRAMEQVPVS